MQLRGGPKLHWLDDDDDDDDVVVVVVVVDDGGGGDGWACSSWRWA